MLKLAYAYKSKLSEAYQKIIFNDRYKYFNYSSYWEYEKEIKVDSWHNIQMVSVDKNDNVLGYLNASISRDTNKISSLEIVNFYDLNMTFSKDLYQFLTDLFEKFNFRKIEFSVVIGNPIEKMYDRQTAKYGGRIIGVVKECTKLCDGLYYDVKKYEIFQRDYIKSKKGLNYGT